MLGALGGAGAGGVKVGTLYAELKLSKDEFDKNIKSSGGIMSGLKGVAVGAAAGIAGALVGVGVAAVGAAKENEVAGARLQAVLKANVKGWDGSTEAIDRANAAGVAKGFNDDQLTDAMSSLVTRTGDVGKATDLLAQSEDLARLKGIDVGTAANIIGKVYSGNTGVLARYGIAVDKGASSHEALAAIQKAAAGQADSYAKTSQGQWDTFDSSLQAVLATVGTALLPILSTLAGIATTVLLPAVQAIGDFLGMVLSPILDIIGGKAGGFGDTLSGIGEMIQTTFAPAFKVLTEQIFPKLQAAFDVIVNRLLPPLKAIFDQIVANVLPPLMAALGILVDVYLTALSGMLDFIINVILPAFAGYLDFIANTVLPIVFKAFDWLSKNVLPIVIKVIDFIVNTVLPALKGALDTVIKFVQDNWPTIQKVFETVGKVIGIVVDTIGKVLGVLGDAVKKAIDFIWPIVSKVADVLFPALRTAADIMGKAIGIVFDGIGKGIGLAKDVISKAVDAISKAWEGLKGMFKTVGDSIGSAVRTTFNAVIGIINGIISAVNSVQVHIGRVGLDTPAGFVGVGPFDWGGLNIPQLGYLASGTDYWRGGMALLGERGPELAMLPRGTVVFDANETRDWRGQIGRAGGPVIGTQNIVGVQPGDVERETARALRRAALDWNLSGR